MENAPVVMALPTPSEWLSALMNCSSPL